MPNEEQKLYNELKKLAKTANQRILRLERLTGQKGLFATKQLYDYLSVVDGVSKSGRIKVSSKYNETQLIAMIKATKTFLADRQNTTVTALKKQKAEVEKSIGKKINWKQLSTLYTASELYKWANEEFGSRFWKDFAPLVFEQSKTEWVDFCAMYIDKINDVTVKNRLKALYDYLRK